MNALRSIHDASQFIENEGNARLRCVKVVGAFGFGESNGVWLGGVLVRVKEV